MNNGKVQFIRMEVNGIFVTGFRISAVEMVSSFIRIGDFLIHLNRFAIQ